MVNDHEQRQDGYWCRSLPAVGVDSRIRESLQRRLRRDAVNREHFIGNLWRWAAGLPELDIPAHHHTTEQSQQNWFPEFVSLMRNRMRFGIYRYGCFRDPSQPNYDRVGSAIKRIHLYRKTGNGEHLIDAANLLGIEFTKRPPSQFPLRCRR